MKKVLAICLMIAMVVSMNVNVLAATGGFVSSPSGTAPEVTVTGVTGEVVVSSYSDKKDLPADVAATFEKAYDDIAKTEDLTKLTPDLAKTAADKKVAAENLAVSDLFDIHVDGTIEEGKSAELEVTLDAATAEKFVALLHLNNSVWEVVDNAKVVDGKLQFSVDSFSPFAIVVDTGAKTPETGDDSMIGLYAAIMGVSAIAVIVIVIKSKKQKA